MLIPRKTLFLFLVIFLTIGRSGLLWGQSPQLSFRVTNPKIGHNSSAGVDSLEFNIEIKSTIPEYADLMQANFYYNTAAFGHPSPFTPVGAVSVYGIGITSGTKYYYQANLNSDHINFSLESNHTWSPGDDLATYWELVGTNWTSLVKIRIKILDNTAISGISFIPTYMTQPINQLYVDNGGDGNQWPDIILDETKSLGHLYLQRIFSSGYNWTQSGGLIDWTIARNTSVWDSTGMIITNGSLANKLRVHNEGRLKIMPGNSLTCMDSVEINEPNGLWLGSEFYGTGSFIDAGIITYHNNGSVGVERYLKQNQWHGYCIPVDTTTTRPFVSLSLAMKWYDEPNHVYRSVVNPGMDSLLNREMLGYLVYSNSVLTGNSTIKVTGSLNTGPVGFPMANSNGPAGQDGWNLTGNPYPSAINWLSSSFLLDRVDPTIYVFHPEAGNYFFWNRHDQLHSTGASAIIAAQQGFYMHANATGFQSGSVNLDNSIRLHSTQSFYKSDSLMNEHLILTVRGNNLTDETRIRFDSATSVLFDADHDAYKLDGVDEAPQLYSVLPDSTRVALNAMPWGGFYTLIPLGFHIGVTTTDTLVASNLVSFLPGIGIWLEDKKTGTWVNLTQTPEYIFTSIPNDNPDRFLLHFSNPYTGLAANTGGFGTIYSFNSSVYVMNRLVEPVSGDIYIYDLTGRLIFKDRLKNIGLNKFEPGIDQGYYIVKVVTDTNACVQKVFLK